MRTCWILTALWFVTVSLVSAATSPVTVTAYQGPSRDGDFEANLQTARGAVEEARARGSRFLLLPECFLSGYRDPEAVRRGARAVDDPALAAFIAESAAHDTVVLAGLARRSGAEVFNSVLAIHRGRLLGWYDKTTPTSREREALGFAAGRQVPVFEAHGVRFGTIVGAEAWSPAVGMAARLQGATILFAPHANDPDLPATEDGRRWIRNVHIGLATQLKVAVVRANTVGVDGAGEGGGGGSFVLSPQGTPLAEAEAFGTGAIHATILPEMYGTPQVRGGWEETPTWLRGQLSELLGAFRMPTDEASLRWWLENMRVHHGYTDDEISEVTGLPVGEVSMALRRFGLEGVRAPERRRGAPPKVLPYPGGRHPRRGFFEGAVAPQRETKVSVFAPWDDGGYVVVDVPEAIFSNLGLTYLAHTHIPTIWDGRGVKLERTEWKGDGSGEWTMERALPNGIAFGTRVVPQSEGVGFELWLRNGTAERLSGLRVQNCAMLGRASGLADRTLENKVFAAPFAAARSGDGQRWVVTAWERCGRAWGNVLVPCIHSDPVFPDCAPGETVRLKGWLSFYEGDDPHSEFRRLEAAGIPRGAIP